MKRLLYALVSLSVFISLFSCGDTQNIGTGLLTDQVEILVDSSFTVTGKSVYEADVQSRTTTQLLGIIEAPSFGRFSSDFVTQFMPSGSLDTTGITTADIDSIKLIFAVPKGAFVGDSVVPMGLEVFPLTAALPSPIYSNFDPTGYFNENQLIASEIYAPNTIYESDSIAELSYRYVYIPLPRKLGQDLYQAYIDNPSSYLSPEAFTKIFPGVYVRNSFGSGRVMRIESSIMRMYYHTTTLASDGVTDSIINTFGNYYAVTPEIITDNIMSYDMSPVLTSMIDNGKAVIAAPTGSEVEMTFPATQLVNSYRTQSGPIAIVNDLEMKVPAAVIANNHGINPPPYLLMVLSSKKADFFNDNNLPDNETSFYASYDEASKSYRFTGMRDYALWLLGKDDITPEDYTFTLTPVSLNFATNNSGYYGSTSYLESVAPYVYEPAMTELDLGKVKIIFTFSRQTQK